MRNLVVNLNDFDLGKLVKANRFFRMGGTKWLRRLQELDEIELIEEREKNSFFDVIGATLINKKGVLFGRKEEILINGLVSRAQCHLSSIESLKIQNRNDNSVFKDVIIDIDYAKDIAELDEYDIRELNYLILGLLGPFHSEPLEGDYFSGNFYFNVTVTPDDELCMSYIRIEC